MPTDEKTPAEPVTERPKKRDVVITVQFKKDIKREQKGPHRATLRSDLQAVVDLLVDDVLLPAHMFDHPLRGNWKNHRDCHIKPDLILIYRKSSVPKFRPPGQPQKPLLHLVRIGSHSELGL